MKLDPQETKPETLSIFNSNDNYNLDQGSYDDKSDQLRNNQHLITDTIKLKELIEEETVSYKRTHQHDQDKVEVDLHKIPVMGILTEPLRGSLHKDDEKMLSMNEYIPTAHVKFLE